jgi:hypothetical protein
VFFLLRRVNGLTAVIAVLSVGAGARAITIT